jgi:TPR repeat protein
MFSAGCPRSPEQPPWPESERNPGLMPKPAGRILWEREIAAADETVADSVTSAQGAALTDPSVLEAQYSAAADEGQVWAQTRLGVLYARAENDPERWQKAVRLLQLAAGQGDGEAQYELAGMAAAGRGMPASDVEAFGYMKEAAERGMADAQYQLAAMYAGGRGTAVDKAAAAEWGRRAAAQNHIPAQFSLGCLLVESDDDAMKSEGVNWLKRAATAGSRKAALFLAAALARGDFKVAKNEGEAELLIKPLADNGDAEAQFILAWLYMFGEKFADRRPLAREYLEMAAKAGHENAAAALKGLPAAP